MSQSQSHDGQVYCALFGADAEVAEALLASASQHAVAAEAREALRRLPREARSVAHGLLLDPQKPVPLLFCFCC